MSAGTDRKTTRRRVSRRTAKEKEIAAVSFKGMPVELAAFGADWDLARGMVARLAVALAKMDDKEMEARGGASAYSVHTFMDAYEKLQEEIAYLKTHAEMLDVVSLRMLAVAHRFEPTLRRPEPPKLRVAVDNTSQGVQPA